MYKQRVLKHVSIFRTLYNSILVLTFLI